ncbi:uncharacterized protein [Brachyistius frenatus]|uniref:uncharacterized protein isoform X1 n=1 Tax=Brachyistius frenatus TaxID=100188 RepID=UPI0037E8FF8F
MRGDTATEDGVEGEERGESTAPAGAASGERRSSLVTLQNMLKKVSQSPFHNQYMHLHDVSAAAADVADDHQPHLGQESVGKDYVTEDAWTKTSEQVHLDAVLVTASEFQSSPLDIQTEETGARLSEPQTHNHKQDVFQTSTLGQDATFNGLFHDVTLSSSDLFPANPSQTQNLSETLQSKSFDLFKGEAEDLFQAAKGDDLLQTAPGKEVNLFENTPSSFRDPFGSPSNKEDDLFRSPQPPAPNPFYTTAGKEADLFQAPKSGELFHVEENKQDSSTKGKDLFGMSFMEDLDTFPSSSTNTIDPFPSPITRTLFQDVSSLEDPFGPTPPKQHDPFQDVWSGTPDIFRPLPSQGNSRDVSETTPGDRTSKITYSTASLNDPSETLSSPDLFKKTLSRPPPAVPPKPFNRPHEIVLTTPRETKHDILQPTPFSRARNLSMSPGQSPSEMTHVRTLRRPPKPLPRTRPPRPEKPPKPERPPPPVIDIEPEPNVPKTSPKPAFRPLPKPLIRLEPKPQETKPVESENYLFEDVLLIGQERCVEDWPEDSPQLNPDFKPTGKLRLRRDSQKIKSDSDGGSGEDQDGTGSGSKKKDKKFRMSLLSRRGSKDKFPDDTKEGRSKTLPNLRKSSKEYFSDTHMSAGENEDDEQNGMDYKKKALKAKVSRLLRRASTNSSVHVNGHQESKDDGSWKKSGGKKNSIIRRWSEGTALDDSSGEEEEGGEGQHDEKGKKKMKIKFVPRRGFSITVEKPTSDEPKGAHGYTPRKGSKEKSSDELLGAHGYTPRKKSQDDAFEDVEEIKARSLQATSKDGFAEDEMAGKDFAEMYDSEQDDLEICKPKKHSKFKALKKLKTKSKTADVEGEDPPGAACSDYLSEAAQAEWLAAQVDERTMAGLEDEDEDGDIDSLMEWWYTVEQWDEVPSDDEDKVIEKDELKSFTVLADKVDHGLRVFNKVFTERAEVLWQSIIRLHAIADDISEFHHKAKIASITGGTTTAVGGVTAIAGLALAPFTLGASLVITAVGVGVATAGGITSASAAISDNVNNMHDRKKVEIVLQEYEGHLLDIGKIFHFINQGLYRLRGHPFLRSGTQHYAEDWEIRRAVQMISLVDSPVMRAMDVTDAALASLQGLFKGMDKYFLKDSRELKKGCKKDMVAQLREVAGELNDSIVELNSIREELQDAMGSV